MKSEITFNAVLTIVLFEILVVSAQFDYDPPIIDETQKPIGSRVVKCLVCKTTLEEMLGAIDKVDPKRTVEIGYSLDDDKNFPARKVQLSKSEMYLTELMEVICDKLDDYAKARFKSNGTLTLLKLRTPNGGMNPDMALVDFVQDGDLNKSLKHFCLGILEDHEEAVLRLLMRRKVPIDSDFQLCTQAAKYCDDLPTEEDYVLEEHIEL